MHFPSKTRFFFVTLLLIGITMNSFGWRNEESEIKLKNLNSQQLNQLHELQLRGDVWPNGTTSSATFYVTPDELDKIRAANIPYEITIDNMNEHYKNFWSDQKHHASTPNGYSTADQINTAIDSLEKAKPSIFKKILLGQSIKNKPIYMIKISRNVSQHENEPQICFDGGIHGDEVGGPQNLILLAKDLCNKYEKDTLITRLVNSREIFLICMINPDGRDNMTRENNANIDLNRDEGYMWGAEGESKSPFSQPETRAFRSAILSNQFVIIASSHSGMEAVFYPWGWSSSASPDQLYHKTLTAAFVSSSGYSNLQNSTSNSDYATRGETLDFAYGSMGVASMTIEISESKQPTDVTGFYNKNLPAMLKLIDYSGFGIEGSVSDSSSGDPISAVLYVNNSLPLYSNPSQGDYHKFVTAGTYNITVTANGYKSKTVSNISVQNLKSTTTNIRLERDTQAKKCYGYKVVSIDTATGSTFAVLNSADNKTCVIKGSQGMIIDMQYAIKNTADSKITVKVSGTSSSYSCFGSQSPDGPWSLLGTSTVTDSFNFPKSTLPTCQYVKIQSKNCPLDAVEGSWDYNFSTRNQQNITLKSKRDPFTLSQLNNKLIISGNSENTTKLSIYDIQGKCITASQIGKGECIVRPLSTGIYIVNGKSDNNQHLQKNILLK